MDKHGRVRWCGTKQLKQTQPETQFDEAVLKFTCGMFVLDMRYSLELN